MRDGRWAAAVLAIRTMTNAADSRGRQGKAFFSEEKNQKTFASGARG
jgi:hypothetical protein